jgi:hypothetical protein
VLVEPLRELLKIAPSADNYCVSDLAIQSEGRAQTAVCGWEMTKKLSKYLLKILLV